MRARNTVNPNKPKRFTPHQTQINELRHKHAQEIKEFIRRNDVLQISAAARVERFQALSNEITKLKNQNEELRGQLQRAIDTAERAEVLRKGAILACDEISKGLFSMMTEFIEKHQLVK